MISCKMEEKEVDIPPISRFIAVSGSSCSSRDVRGMELLVLKASEWNGELQSKRWNCTSFSVIVCVCARVWECVWARARVCVTGFGVCSIDHILAVVASCPGGHTLLALFLRSLYLR